MKNYFSKLAGVMLVALPFLMSSCGEDEVPAPTVSISFTISEDNDHEVNFSAVATDTDTYLWEFGDDETSTEQNPVHTYAKGGEYTVTCTVTGAGGTDLAQTTISINVSDEELLTGTWVVDGASNLVADEIFGDDDQEIGAGMIGALIPDLTADKFIFNADGTFSMEDDGNGMCFSSAVSALTYYYSIGEPISDPDNDDRVGVYIEDYGICSIKYDMPENATWEIKTGDLVINEGTEDEKKFENVKYIELSEGAFLGMFNMPNYVILNELTPTSLNVTLMFNAHAKKPEITNYTVTLTFTNSVPK